MLLALTHIVSPNIVACELTFLQRRRIDYNLAAQQHREYSRLLSDSGLQVIELSVNSSYPDSTFIEDTAVVFDELAIMASMGTVSRRGEINGIEAELAKFRDIFRIEFPATLEGGDVLRVGKKVFAGITPRTNLAGIESLRKVLEPLGYEVIPVQVTGCLHLKSACTAIGERSLLANPRWLELKPLEDFRIIPVAEDEPMAANCLCIRDTLVMHTGFSKTIDRLQDFGFPVKSIDISELLKAEAGLTCKSIIFEHRV